MSLTNVEALVDGCRTSRNYEALLVYLLSDEGSKLVIQQINKYISVSNTRNTGFEFLLKVLPYCSHNILSDNATHWISICISPAQRGPVNNTHLDVIGGIIKYSQNIQEFNKCIVSTYLSKIIEACIQYQSHETSVEISLKCLEICMRTYPSTCGPFKAKIEKFLLSFIDVESNINMQKNVGRCLHYLQQIGGAGSEKANYILNWSQYFKKLCRTMHHLYDSFFEDVSEFEDWEANNMDPCDFSPIPSTSSKEQMNLILYKRLQHLTMYLRAFLETAYPTLKNVSINSILDLLKRGLSIHQCINSGNGLNNRSQFASLHLDHQSDLLYLFRSVIACLKESMIPFSFMINNIFLNCQKRTHTCSCFTANRKYIQSFHIAFRYWIEHIKSNMNNTFHEKFISLLLKDVEPSKEEITLSLNTDISKQKSSKAKKKAVRDQIISSATQTISNSRHQTAGLLDMRAQACKYSLQTLQCFFENVTLNISRKLKMQLYDLIIQTMCQIHRNNTSHPYTDIGCECALYYALYALVKQPTLFITPSLSICINLFTTGTKHHSLQIRNVCANGLSYLEKITQPIYPSLILVNPNPPQNKTDTDGSGINSNGLIDVEEDEDIDGNAENNGINSGIEEVDDCVEEVIQLIDESELESKENSEEDVKNSKKIKVLDVQVIKPPIPRDSEDSIPKIIEAEKPVNGKEVLIPIPQKFVTNPVKRLVEDKCKLKEDITVPEKKIKLDEPVSDNENDMLNSFVDIVN